MDDLHLINREFNRTARELDRLVGEVATSSSLAERKEVLRLLGIAMESLHSAHRVLLRQNPDLDYHFDVNKKRTPFMINIKMIIEESERAVQRGEIENALNLISRALALEPPSLTYERLKRWETDLLQKHRGHV